MALGDIIEIREKLDHAYAEEIVKKMALHEHPELHALVERMEKLAADGDLGKATLDADREFHKIIAKKANNLFLLQLVEAFWDVEEVVFPKLGLNDVENAKSNAQMHRRLLAAAERGDLPQYQKLTVEHYMPLKNRLPRPNYFPDENTH